MKPHFFTIIQNLLVLKGIFLNQSFFLQAVIASNGNLTSDFEYISDLRLKNRWVQREVLIF